MTLFGAHAAIWGVVATSVQQRAAPDRLRGRVNSVYQLLSVSGAAVGAALGGLLAHAFGLTAPFWLAFAAMVPVTALVWRRLGAARDVLRSPSPSPAVPR